MTEHLEKSRDALINYRLERAKETLVEAQYNADGGYYNAAVNRLYYACFYASLALLLKFGLEAGTHKGVKTMLGLHFISTGKIPSKMGSTYQTLFNNRIAGDYEEFVFCDSELYNELRPKAEEFVKEMINQIQ